MATYQRLCASGELGKRVEQVLAMPEHSELRSRRCGVNRMASSNALAEPVDSVSLLRQDWHRRLCTREANDFCSVWYQPRSTK
ncbi:hypothetical protein ACFLVD_00965 [Chloroflexota bacterium]